MAVSELSDGQLQALADGAAESELYRRKEQRRQEEERREREQREAAKQSEIRSMDADALRALAEDPRTMRNDKRVETWGLIDFNLGWSKEEVVQAARAEIQRRRRVVQRRETAKKAAVAALMLFLLIGGQ